MVTYVMVLLMESNYDGQPECRIEGDIDFETAGKYDVELVK